MSAQLRQFIKANRHLPTLSLYVEGGLSDPASQRAWRVSMKHALSTARAAIRTAAEDEREAFAACVARVEAQLPSESALHSAGGWCCLCASEGELFETLMPMRVPTVAAWRVGPMIGPHLAIDRDGPVFVLQIDHDSARIQQLRDSGLEAVEAFEAEFEMGAGAHMGDAPQRGFHSGTVGETLTELAQRRQNAARDRMLAATVRGVVGLIVNHTTLIVGGPPEVTHHLLSRLPASVTDRTRVAPDVRMQTPPSEVIAAAEAALATFMAERQQRWFAQVRERLFADRHAAMGIDDARQAVAVGAVEHLGFSEAYFRDHPDDAEALAQDALLQGASVSILTPAVADEVDREAGGVAASLRFAVAHASA